MPKDLFVNFFFFYQKAEHVHFVYLIQQVKHIQVSVFSATSKINSFNCRNSYYFFYQLIFFLDIEK